MKYGKNYRKNAMILGMTGALLLGSGIPAEAASADGFLAEVPVSDWSYSAVNSLIQAGVVPDYAMPIPQGRVMSRMEMAMIVDSAMKNQSAMTAEQVAAVKKLDAEYYYDIKKVDLLNKLDRLSDEQVNAVANGQTAPAMSADDQKNIKRLAQLADKFDVGGYVRIRNDHYLKDQKNGTGTQRTQRANMIHIAVQSKYKINKDWTAHTDIGYRNSLSGFTDYRSTPTIGAGENKTGLTMDTYINGKFPKLYTNMKFGKWNEWNPFGWGMDIDCDFIGAQFTHGKTKFKTFLTAGQMDLWDNLMGGKRKKEKVTSLRFFYPFDAKNDANFGVSFSHPMASRYQSQDQNRVFYYYAHAHHKFDRNWDLRVGTINSNAKRDADNAVAGTKTKKPGRWVQLQYKKADLRNPGTYDITADYRYEPALVWPTVTDWCGLNEKFIRLKFSYVPTKNVLIDTFYTWGREIDTGARDDMYRFQAQFFF